MYILSWNCHGKYDFTNICTNINLYDFIHLSETHHSSNTHINANKLFKIISNPSKQGIRPRGGHILYIRKNLTSYIQFTKTYEWGIEVKFSNLTCR